MFTYIYIFIYLYIHIYIYKILSIYSLCQERGLRNFTRSCAADYSRPADYSRLQPTTADYSRPADYSRLQPTTAEHSRLQPTIADYWLQPSTADYSRLQPSIADYSRPEPSTAEFRGAQPSTAESYTCICNWCILIFSVNIAACCPSTSYSLHTCKPQTCFYVWTSLNCFAATLQHHPLALPPALDATLQHLIDRVDTKRKELKSGGELTCKGNSWHETDQVQTTRKERLIRWKEKESTETTDFTCSWPLHNSTVNIWTSLTSISLFSAALAPTKK